MAKSIEQLKAEARILKEARAGMKKERREGAKKVLKNIVKGARKTTIPKVKKIRKSSAIGYRRSLSGNLVRTFTGQQQGPSQSKRRVKDTPGRPRGDYKHRDPVTGQPIPATLYYKRIKEVKRQAQQAAQMRDLQAIRELGKRGIPPEQAKQIVDSRQLQSVGVQPQQFQTQPQQFQQQYQQQQLTPQQFRQLQLQRQMQQQPQQMREQLPSSYPSQAVRPIWRRQPVEGFEVDMFGNKRRVIRNLPQSFWN